MRDADVMQSAVYGKCIFADYNNVHKDMCAKEFMRLKECYLVGLQGCDVEAVLICYRKRTRHGDVANQRLCDCESTISSRHRQCTIKRRKNRQLK